ncbi:hypothetical protein SAMN05444166_5727 [Singulisphaera sp. GP187]|nr:hypothetical protein SAMN05444166_5727 [Singulisphaera sp. GP187]
MPCCELTTKPSWSSPFCGTGLVEASCPLFANDSVGSRRAGLTLASEWRPEPVGSDPLHSGAEDGPSEDLCPLILAYAGQPHS